MAPSKFLMLSILTLFIHTVFSHPISEQTHIATHHHKRVVSVDDFSAKGDGVTNDKQAFHRAWKKTCASPVPAVLLVPKHRTYLVAQLNFTGPCKSHVTVQIKGTIEASKNRSDWSEKDQSFWIAFNRTRNLVVEGGGTINGNGHIWWQHSCKIDKSLPCVAAPVGIIFQHCKQLTVKNLEIKDSPKFQVVVKDSLEAKLSKLFIHAPGKSPNTDGIHLSHARKVDISNCDIRTGDDCISIWAGSKNVKIHKIYCGPGHGISIGSLGKNKTSDHVMNVKVDKVTMNGTTNGVRIKTWQGGRGYAKYITFKNIAMHNVENPIIVDQFYCDSKDPCPEQHNAVAVKHVLFKNIAGTSASNVSVTLNCSRTVPCSRIRLQNIELVGVYGQSTESSCKNVHLNSDGIVIPTPCVSRQNVTAVAGMAEKW